MKSQSTIVAILALLLIQQPVWVHSKDQISPNIIKVPAFDLPESAFLSEESRNVIRMQRQEAKEASYPCPNLENASIKHVPTIRECQRNYFYTTPAYQRMIERYDVDISTQTIAGVYVEVFMPTAGIEARNKDKVLINLHGGAFKYGSRTSSRVESIPIAATAKMKVISVDYRLGPEHQFPAASLDVTAVYQVLLKTYKPENIGLYGCAGGGMLTAQSIAWFQKEKLPIPGAVGMFCMAAAEPRPKVDSMYINSAIMGIDGIAPFTVFEAYYGKKPNFNDPLLVPIRSDEVMSKFPTSLLIGSTREFHLSSIVHTHSTLVRLGVDADLHIWEGFGHIFFNDPALPEAREVYRVIADFFNKHLGG